MENKVESFVRATKATATTLKCGFYLFAVEACMPEGVSIAVAHNIAGSRMLHALSHIVKISYREMLKSGMSEAFARSVVMSMAESGIREAGND